MTFPVRLNRLLSGDKPESRLLSVAILCLFALVLVAPFLGAGQSFINAMARVAILVVLVASFDLLLGYTGIISFAHTMFLGIGAYGVGLASHFLGSGWLSIILGLVVSLIVAFVMAALIGLFSMRVRAIFFAMITLAVASVFVILVTQFYQFTGGHDGRTFQLPQVFRPANVLVDPDVFGVAINGSTIVYYLIVAVSACCFLAMLRIVNSPFGRALKAVRENEFRAEAIGLNVLNIRVLINCLAACLACVAGFLSALWLRYVSPESTMGTQVMLDILLMTVIGGMGTLYGAIVGAGIFVLAETYLKLAIAMASDSIGSVPVLAAVVHPDRWMFWLGLMFVLCVYYFPEGIVGRLRKRHAQRRAPPEP